MLNKNFHTLSPQRKRFLNPIKTTLKRFLQPIKTCNKNLYAQVQWVAFLMIFMRIAKQTMSAKDKYMYQRSFASQVGVVCETSTSEEDWRKLKDYFADAATRLHVKKVNYYVWFQIIFILWELKIERKRVIIKVPQRVY